MKREPKATEPQLTWEEVKRIAATYPQDLGYVFDRQTLSQLKELSWTARSDGAPAEQEAYELFMEALDERSR